MIATPSQFPAIRYVEQTVTPDAAAANQMYFRHPSGMTGRIYDMHHGAICTVSRRGVQYLDWLRAFSAGRLDYGAAAW